MKLRINSKGDARANTALVLPWQVSQPAPLDFLRRRSASFRLAPGGYRPRIPHSHHFTLVEVLIALAILTMGILAAAGLISGAQSRSITAAQQWEEQHAMAQAAEYLLLAGIDGQIPQRFFPFENYQADYRYANPVNLPPEVNDREIGWRLATLHIRLVDDQGNTVRELSIDRILKTGEK